MRNYQEQQMIEEQNVQSKYVEHRPKREPISKTKFPPHRKRLVYYGDNTEDNLLEKAVRWVIILIVLVFDPLALVLILAADQTFAWHREDKKKREGWSQVWQPNSEAWPELNDLPPATEDFDPRPTYEPDDGPLTDAQLDKIQELADQQIAEEQTKNTTLTRELEAVKATAETLKKKFMNSFSNLLKK
jgi:hypothetical protein